MTTPQDDLREMSTHFYNKDRGKTAFNALPALLDKIEALTKANAELREALEEILEALRIHAPGTPLNNHRFDALGIKAHAALARKP